MEEQIENLKTHCGLIARKLEAPKSYLILQNRVVAATTNRKTLPLSGGLRPDFYFYRGVLDKSDS
jgi:hypothetical protein|tara:strand:+ start:135 stop:329 length:195 start_codon:yes stop_codon:yes gene_type:complete